jgi:hypothetical protein
VRLLDLLVDHGHLVHADDAIAGMSQTLTAQLKNDSFVLRPMLFCGFLWHCVRTLFFVCDVTIDCEVTIDWVEPPFSKFAGPTHE